MSLSVGTLHHSIIVGSMALETLQTVSMPATVLGYTAPASAVTSSGSGDITEPEKEKRSVLNRMWTSLFGQPAPPPNISLHTEHPTVFSFSDSQSDFFQVPVNITMRHLSLKRRYVIVRCSVVYEVLVRESEYVPFNAAHGAVKWRNDAQNACIVAQLKKKQSRKEKQREKDSKCERHCTTLWKHERKIRLPLSNSNGSSNRADDVNIEVSVPISIDTHSRANCLRDWPCASNIKHTLGETAQLRSFTVNAPLVRTKYTFIVDILQLDSPHAYNNQRAIGQLEVLPTCSNKGELFVLPPETSTTSGDVTGAAAAISPRTSQSLLSVAAGVAVTAATPQAHPAPRRVVGELISRGPAAVLVDRGARRPRSNDNITAFGSLYPVNVNDAMCIAGTPLYSPALAFVCNARYTNGVLVPGTMSRSRRGTAGGGTGNRTGGHGVSMSLRMQNNANMGLGMSSGVAIDTPYRTSTDSAMRNTATAADGGPVDIVEDVASPVLAISIPLSMEDEENEDGREEAAREELQPLPFRLPLRSPRQDGDGEESKFQEDSDSNPSASNSNNNSPGAGDLRMGSPVGTLPSLFMGGLGGTLGLSRLFYGSMELPLEEGWEEPSSPPIAQLQEEQEPEQRPDTMAVSPVPAPVSVPETTVAVEEEHEAEVHSDSPALPLSLPLTLPEPESLPLELDYHGLLNAITSLQTEALNASDTTSAQSSGSISASGRLSKHILSLLQSCVLHRTGPRQMHATTQILPLLLAMQSTTDRELVLMFILQYKWYLQEEGQEQAQGYDVVSDMCESGGCVDQCFPLSIHRERVKNTIRMDVMASASASATTAPTMILV